MKCIVILLALCVTAVFCQDIDPPISQEDVACFVSEGTALGADIIPNCPDQDLFELQAGDVSFLCQ